MKPERQLIPDKKEKSFIARRLERKCRPLFSQAWHYHPEIEVCFTQFGHGKRFVGNNIAHYQENDLVMFGSNLPHGFMTNDRCVQIVILFGQDFLGDNFFEKPELANVKTLLGRAKNGLSFRGESRKKAKAIIRKILNSEGLQKTIYFLELLNVLANARDAEPICNEEYIMDLKAVNFDRMKTVYNHIMENYQREISVKEMADLINLTEVSFFKFIKRHTDKTLTQMVNEFRINHATKLLMSTEKSIAEICYECGYNNISYFNRKFREIMDETPTEFKNLFNGQAKNAKTPSVEVSY
jgi:AraC-like DNA-binding protein